MSKQFWAILAAIVLVFVGVLLVNKHDTKAPTATGNPTNHVEGTSPKGIKLVEYGDYQCPGCGEFYQTVKEVAAKYNKQVVFQFRNLPLTSLHPNTFAASRAAEAAAMQDKFWQMHDALYDQNQVYYKSNGAATTWVSAKDPIPFFNDMAKQLGLNMTKFKSDFSSTKVNNLINADVAAFLHTSYAGGDQSKEATPTFFLNGSYLDNSSLLDSQGQPSVDAFSKLIDAALKDAPAAKS